MLRAIPLEITVGFFGVDIKIERPPRGTSEWLEAQAWGDERYLRFGEATAHTLVLPGKKAIWCSRCNEQIKEPGPGFWRECRKLFFAFEDGDQQQIQRFYHNWGPPGGHPQGASGQAYGEAHASLRWFNRIICLYEWAKATKTQPFIDELASAKVVGGYAYLGSPATKWSIPIPLLGKEGTYRLPSNDSETLVAMFGAISLAVESAFQNLSLAPGCFKADAHGLIHDFIFLARSPIEYALLDWYMANCAVKGEVKLCECGCGQVVMPPRAMYATDRCKMRESKRRYRARKKAAKQEVR